MSKPLLQGQALRLDYGSKTVFEDIDIEVAQGEIVALVGASGSGKSSLLSVLAGLHTPSAGSITLDDAPLRRGDPRVGVVFQQANLLPWLNVAENVAFGLNFAAQGASSKAEKAARVHALLDEVGLHDLAQADVASLSGGMAQRVSLARTLACNPQMIFLDEPFSALDPSIRADMQALLLQLVAEHQATALIVTHDIDEALLLADRVLLLAGGELADQWRISFAHPRQERLLAMNGLRVQILKRMQELRYGYETGWAI